MNDVLELVAAIARWSRQGQMSGFFLQGTLWYGMMCRTFLLLERILRSIAIELSSLAPKEAAKIADERAGGKPFSRMTFGQCLVVVEILVPLVSEQVYTVCPKLELGQMLLTDSDVKLWRRAVFLRNRMAHHGPGFLDSVDLNAGRIWRSSVEREPLEEQAEEIWQICRLLCASPLVVTYLALKGTAPDVTRAELMNVEHSIQELQLEVSKEVRTSGNVAALAVDEFHGSSMDAA